MQKLNLQTFKIKKTQGKAGPPRAGSDGQKRQTNKGGWWKVRVTP